MDSLSYIRTRKYELENLDLKKIKRIVF